MWRRRISAVVLSILAFTLIVSFPPLLRRRESMAPARADAACESDRHPHRARRFPRGFCCGSHRPRNGPIRFSTPRRSAEALRTLLRTPVDFLFTMALLAALLILAFDSDRTAEAQDPASTAASGDATRLGDVRDYSARRRRPGRAASGRLRGTARKRHRCDLGRCTSLFAAPARRRTARVRRRPDSRAGGHLLGRNPRGHHHVGALAHTSLGRTRAWRDLPCRQFPF